MLGGHIQVSCSWLPVMAIFNYPRVLSSHALSSEISFTATVSYSKYCLQLASVVVHVSMCLVRRGGASKDGLSMA